MIVMGELPAGDTHDVIHRGGQVVAVVVPIEDYRQLRQAMQEQQRYRRHGSVVSVQVVRTMHGAVLLIIRRSWVRAPPAPRDQVRTKSEIY